MYRHTVAPPAGAWIETPTLQSRTSPPRRPPAGAWIETLPPRRYRNRRLGEFLKELDLTEGRATGIPTIQEELRDNGSPQATIETDEERTYFLIDIPCHPDFVVDKVILNRDGVKDGVKELSGIQEIIISEIQKSPSITTGELAQKIDVKFRTLQRYISQLQSLGVLTREGGRKEGHWVIIKDR